MSDMVDMASGSISLGNVPLHPPDELMQSPKNRTSTQKSFMLYNEPINTPGVIPMHLKRAASGEFPLLEVLQRLLIRLKPETSLEGVLTLIALWKVGKPVYEQLKRFVLWACTSQITIPEHDPVSRDVMLWMSSKVIGNVTTTRAMLVTGDLQDPTDNFYRQMMRDRTGQYTQQSDEVQCLPPIGKRIFWIGFRPFLFSRVGGQSGSRYVSSTAINKDGQLENAITITTLGWSLKPLQDFVKSCHDFKIENNTGTTTVFFSGGQGGGAFGGSWASVTKAVRKLDTIDMDESVKADLIKDAEYYYSTESKKFFADCGIPYRRGYLFHGPPGTGKSSFSAALAGHLKCDIYIINLATGDVSDGRLHNMFLELPKKCIVVIEDIDSAGIGREQGKSSKAQLVPPAMQPGFPPLAPGMVVPPVPPPQRRNKVTLSGLLNAIDGNASAEGRLLIMTSNNPEALDEALTRPGRIDKQVHFGNIGQPAARGIFLRLIGRAALAHDSDYTTTQMEQYAIQFAEKIPTNTFTPAQLQNFLQACRGDPEMALQNIDAWMEQNRPTSSKFPDKRGELRKAKTAKAKEVEKQDNPSVLDTSAGATTTQYMYEEDPMESPLDDAFDEEELMMDVLG